MALPQRVPQTAWGSETFSTTDSALSPVGNDSGTDELDSALVRGRLKNSETLDKLDMLLAHLPADRAKQLAELIQYIKGKDNVVADVLSRAPV